MFVLLVFAHAFKLVSRLFGSQAGRSRRSRKLLRLQEKKFWSSPLPWEGEAHQSQHLLLTEPHEQPQIIHRVTKCRVIFKRIGVGVAVAAPLRSRSTCDRKSRRTTPNKKMRSASCRTYVPTITRGKVEPKAVAESTLVTIRIHDDRKYRKIRRKESVGRHTKSRRLVSDSSRTHQWCSKSKSCSYIYSAYTLRGRRT